VGGEKEKKKKEKEQIILSPSNVRIKGTPSTEKKDDLISNSIGRKGKGKE